VSTDRFVKLRDSNVPTKYAAFVTMYTPEEYRKKEAKTYTSQSGQSGYAIAPDGDLISVFSKPGTGAGADLMRAAIKNGAKKLDCIGPYLPQFYAKFGFQEHDRMAWNDRYAPPGWNYEKFGRPDIILMGLGAKMKSVSKDQKSGTDDFRKLSMGFAEDFFGKDFVTEILEHEKAKKEGRRPPASR